MNRKQLLTVAMALATMGVNAQTNSAPTMGWSSWNTYRVNISDSLIRHQADCMVKTGLKDAGYKYINIDDGFQGGRGADGKLKINPHRFPFGLKPVADYIHSMGLKAGIYSDAGRNTCGNYYDKDTLAVRVGMYEHDDVDARFYFKDMGFDFIKIDYCGGDAKQNTDRLQLDEETRYTAIRKAIDATGRTDVRMNVCRWNYPGTWVSGVADSWRTTVDIYDGWKSVAGILRENLYLSAYSSDGHYNDMDMLEVGRSMTQEEDKTHFGMWCVMESPLLIGCDLGSIKPQTLALLKNPELLALSQDAPHQQAYPVALSNGVYILVKDVNTLHGLQRAVAFYNPSAQAAEATLSFRDVDLAGTIAVRDVFERKDEAARTDGQMQVSVPGHGCRIYLLTATKRLERQRYEAETAYISDYQELWNNQAKKTGIYEYDDRCSAGMKATWLGCSTPNDLQWKHVYVNKAGKRTLSFKCLSPDKRQFTVSVNGTNVKTLTVDGNATVSLKVKLQKGDNIVRLYNEQTWMPDVDCMTVK